VLAVAGTHGKTTTTAMLAWILEHAGLAPGFLIGGVPLNFGVSARLGGRSGKRPFVIEADEYDTAFFDKRSKFVHYRPRTAILNNLEYDHADIFDDLAAIERQFHHLVRTVPGQGRLVVNARDEALQRVLAMGCWSEVQRFGARKEEPGVLRARGDPHAFDVLRGGLRIARVEWQLLGEHNQLNALAAIAAAEHVGVAADASARALAEFGNVRRRLELRGTVDGIAVYDDFAHHPTAIRTTIEGLRRKVGDGARILAVFEPRSNTMKLGAMKALLPWALEEADLAFCHAGGLGWDAGQALAPMGARAVVAATIDELVASVVGAARSGDHVLCMSNGSFGGIHQKLLDAFSLRGRAAA
jgi:UDP-N-acetylmuramate: L-alanyl-gamma-D-glutamyl-meso-diaminopimelate ligase